AGAQGIFLQMKFYQHAIKAILLSGCAVLIGLAAAGSGLAQTKSSPAFPFANGEELLYQAEFSRALLRGVDVAEFRFTSVAENISRGLGKDTGGVVRLTGDVKSKGFFLRLVGYHFHQQVESVADTAPFTVLKTK